MTIYFLLKGQRGFTAQQQQQQQQHQQIQGRTFAGIVKGVKLNS